MIGNNTSFIYYIYFVLLYSDYSVSILTTEDSAPLRSRAIRRLVELVDLVG